MTEQQQIWFEKLAQDREDSAKTLEKPSMRGIKNSVVEKYSDQAHFIYELLQNANDAKATKSSFQLTTDGLYFRHNGKILFSVSNPDTEDYDKENNTLGHLNSITAIANSNKTESSIGKFGVGFKAVFQYTETPHIYDPNYQFKIDRFIIPVKLNNDLSDRLKEETVFYFPFNKNEISKDKAYTDILEKLKNLVFPTLFLTNLQEVKWIADNEIGEYIKKNSEQKQANNITYKKLELYQQVGLNKIKEKLFLFSRSTNENHSYSIGFFLDEKNRLIPKQHSAFCFFPTKEATNFNFILHAPFLLTDSREGIHRSKEHNTKMVDLLSQLAADSLLILKELNLIDDNIFEILPYKKIKYGHDDFFNNVFQKIKQTFKTEEVLPTKDKSFVHKQNAYWADSPDLANLFSNKQLAELVKNENAKWVFSTIGRTKDKEITDYIDGGSERYWEKKEPNLIKSNIDFENKIAELITNDFIENQSDEWLHKLYEYLYERKSYQEKFKTKPIFKDILGNAVPAFEQNGKELHEILFLPLNEINSTYKTINPELLKNKKTKDFFENFGIKKPSLKDEIYNNILPLYKKEDKIDTESHLNIFFTYWKKEGRPEEFIELIKKIEFISYKIGTDKEIYRGIANNIYYPTLELHEYFETKTDIRFVYLEDYYTFIKNEEEQQILKEFLLKLGVKELPKLFVKQIKNTYHEKENIYFFDGLKEFIKTINDISKSITLWNILKRVHIEKLKRCERSSRPDGRHNFRTEYFSSPDLIKIRNEKWLMSKNETFVAPSEITINELSEIYEVDNYQSKQLIEILEFKPLIELTEIERIAQKFENEEDAELAKKLLENYKARQNPNFLHHTNSSNLSQEEEEEEVSKTYKISKTIKDLEDLQNVFPTRQKENRNQNLDPKSKIDFNEDEEFSKGIEELKKQLEIKKSRVDLSESINNSVKYSYDWFKTYLQLLTTYGEKQDNQKQKSISFQEIKPYKKDNKYFLLCGASSYISSEIENANDFKISLIFGNGKRENIIVEGVSKKGQDLLIYCREPLAKNTLSRISNIFKIEINFTPVIDLLDRLERAFVNDNYIDKWENIEEAIPPLNYIYGPPGTGKTTTLCNSINEILSSKPNTKFLVLTPTNKASDVVCKKLQEINSSICSVRLSNPTDPELEEFQIYRDSLNYEDMQNIDIVSSTIHRLPYFDIQEIGFLFQYKWDYVIFDESSMIGLHYITFAIMALFKTNPNINFIIAGDPKQIPPVVEIDEKELDNFDFQDENIYKMMNLQSFNPNEQIIRKFDNIDNLTTQYRSVPYIGQLFSELSYSCKLKHDRGINNTEVKPLPEKFKSLIVSNVTFIDIPLNQENSIYRVNKLFYSSYHTYCSILVSEIVKYLDTTNKSKKWKVGIISPYKAQAMIINKLITSYGISENIKVISDTVHGFQGDQCDIVFFVCNPNNYFFSNHEKALLSKEYIYNVAISRAMDYLVVLHPYTTIPNNIFINKIGHSYKNNFGNAKILNVKTIEKILFNDENYIEKNCYISGHDNINVFGLSEMKYFIKSNDTAIDIQLKDIK